jgi:hypothetical protein
MEDPADTPPTSNVIRAGTLRRPRRAKLGNTARSLGSGQAQPPPGPTTQGLAAVGDELAALKRWRAHSGTDGSQISPGGSGFELPVPRQIGKGFEALSGTGLTGYRRGGLIRGVAGRANLSR